jgi:hypothetical protein
MKQAIGLERVDRLGECKAAMQGEPFPGVAVPLEDEAVAADPVEAVERGVERFAEILWEARAVALDEAILSAVPLAEE